MEQIKDFDKSTQERLVQAVDKESGLPMWSVSVLDPDPAAHKADKTTPVKTTAGVARQRDGTAREPTRLVDDAGLAVEG